MAAITSAALSLVGSGAQIYSAEKSKKDAKDSIRNFNRQELENPYENLQISTLKSEQLTDANLSNTASSVEALRRGGTRSLIGGIPLLNQNSIALQNAISADLDKQEKERQMLIARGEENIQNVRESRETNALLGYGQQLQTGRQDSASGIASAFSGILNLGNAIEDKKDDDVEDTFTDPFSTNPLGVLKATSPSSLFGYKD